VFDAIVFGYIAASVQDVSEVYHGFRNGAGQVKCIISLTNKPDRKAFGCFGFHLGILRLAIATVGACGAKTFNIAAPNAPDF